MALSSHQECFYGDSASCDSSIKIRKEFAKKNNQWSRSNLLPASEGTPIEPVCVLNPHSDPFFKPDDLGREISPERNNWK